MHFVKTVDATPLKVCTILKLVSLNLEQTIAQIQYTNYSNGLCSVKWRNGNGFYLFQKAKIFYVITLDCLLPETNRILKDLFD